MDTPESKSRVLIIGGTGYIGGSILSTLLASPATSKNYAISVLIRNPSQASFFEEKGIKVLLFKGLDDVNRIEEVCGGVDVVIACANARDLGCARACIAGLSRRKDVTGKEGVYIHTSGASTLSDSPLLTGRIDREIHSDLEDIRALEKSLPDGESEVRKVDLRVLELGEELGVNVRIVVPPLIFGKGLGFTKGIGQIDMFVKLAFIKHQAVIVGDGSGIWSRIHIQDVSNLYLLILQDALSSSPSSQIHFAENGEQSWLSLATEINKIGFHLGIFKTENISTISLDEVAQIWCSGNKRTAEEIFISNSRIKADKARKELSWDPKFGEEEFLEDIKRVIEEFAAAEGN